MENNGSPKRSFWRLYVFVILLGLGILYLSLRIIPSSTDSIKYEGRVVSLNLSTGSSVEFNFWGVDGKLQLGSRENSGDSTFDPDFGVMCNGSYYDGEKIEDPVDWPQGYDGEVYHFREITLPYGVCIAQKSGVVIRFIHPGPNDKVTVIYEMSPREAKIIYGLSYTLVVLVIVIMVISVISMISINWIWKDTRRRK